MSFFRQERNIHKKVTYLFMGGGLPELESAWHTG